MRNVFVIGSDKKIKLMIVYPTTGRNFDEVLRVIDSLLRNCPGFRTVSSGTGDRPIMWGCS